MHPKLKPIDLYDVARMCVQSYRANPEIAGWQRVSPSEMRLSDAFLAAVPYVNRVTTAWFKPGQGPRKALLAIVLKSNSDTITTRYRLDDAEIAADAVEVVEPVINNAVRWAESKGIDHVLVVGHHVGALIAREVAGRIRTSGRTSVTVVTLGSGTGVSPQAEAAGGVVDGGVRFLEVWRGQTGQGGGTVVEVSRADEYLADIASMYTDGDLVRLLEPDSTHKVIRLRASAGAR